jgi:hypothetical protein
VIVALTDLAYYADSAYAIQQEQTTKYRTKKEDLR